MPAINRRAALKKLKHLVFTPRTDLTKFRKRIEDKFARGVLPNHVDCRPVTVHGIASDMLIPQISSNKRMVLYVHGGSFMGGSKASWRNFCASLANESSSRVLVPDFRLAPEHAFPAAIEDILAVYKRMCDHHVDIVFVADGSGANIALAAALSLPKELRRYFKGMVLFSPWLDISADSLIYSVKTKDPIFSQDIFKFCSTHYTYEANLENPLVSPLKADISHFENFPPIYIQAGSEELMVPCIKKFEAKMKEAKVACHVEIFDNLFHFFQFVHEDVPQTHLAVESVGKFIKALENSEASGLDEDDLWN
ncbi:MAG: alpha/beta hydrolase [Treponema sp.]|jgi:acetyl esterase/lipase|nr:alpha/beta hydrolase [Treponema sp.]